MEQVYQVMTKLLDGKTTILNFTTPSIPVISIKTRIHQLTSIPIHHQLLLSNGKHLHDQTHLSYSDLPTVHLLLRLRGGKGGFGSLLRGAATKAGQKKTNNFDACRDMSGRRLRHVNAEKKMEEWRAEAEDRRLEKMAEDFIKKKSKLAKKDGGSGDAADKYVDKYRKDSAKCMGEVDKSVRESLAGFVKSKRKGAAIHPNNSQTKKFKIWMGKRKFGETDSDEDDEMRDENEKSVVLNNESHSDSSKEPEGSSTSVAGGKLDGESQQDKDTFFNGQLDSSTLYCDVDGPSEPTLEIQNKVLSCLEVTAVSQIDAEMTQSTKINVEEMVSQPPSISSAGAFAASDAQPNGSPGLNVVVHEEIVVVSTVIPDLEKPLNFDEFNSSNEMEVLGMERLKSELQARGLKCGGTLQERAARLFLLKTMPVEMVPKKLLAKK